MASDLDISELIKYLESQHDTVVTKFKPAQIRSMKTSELLCSLISFMSELTTAQGLLKTNGGMHEVIEEHPEFGNVWGKVVSAMSEAVVLLNDEIDRRFVVNT